MADEIVRHKCCPQCGSKKFKFAKSSTKLVDKGPAAAFPIRDRTCKECGTFYHPEMPAAIPYALMGGGVCVFLMGVMAFFAPVMSGEIEFRWWAKVLFLVAGGGLLFAGIQLFRKRP